MKWLITFFKDADINSLKEQLQQWQVNLPEEIRITPLGDTEAMIEVEGPQELPQLASSANLEIQVYPSSQVEPFARF
jgi:hypothetical protein